MYTYIESWYYIEKRKENGMGAKYTEAQARASAEYLKKMDEIRVRMPKGRKELFQEHAKKNGESLNAFVLRAIEETMRREA